MNTEPSGHTAIRGIQEGRPYIASVGRSKQVRIMQTQDDRGNDIPPGLKEFLEEGSRKQPRRETAEGTGYIEIHRQVIQDITSESFVKQPKDRPWDMVKNICYSSKNMLHFVESIISNPVWPSGPHICPISDFSLDQGNSCFYFIHYHQ